LGKKKARVAFHGGIRRPGPQVLPRLPHFDGALRASDYDGADASEDLVRSGLSRHLLIVKTSQRGSAARTSVVTAAQKSAPRRSWPRPDLPTALARAQVPAVPG
jgi:hypothetical protein